MRVVLGVLGLAAMAGCAGMDMEPSQPSNQVLWSKGKLSRQWLGRSLGMVSNNTRLGSIDTVHLRAPAYGDSPVLAYVANGGGDPAGFVGGIVFYNYQEPSPSAAAYYPAGHIQFDLLLGPGFDPASDNITVFYGNGSFGNCGSKPLQGLSKTEFTHVSLPLADFPGSCNWSHAVNFLSITCNKKTGSAGAQFYLDDVKWTID